MNLDLRATPFSRYGSHLSVSLVNLPEPTLLVRYARTRGPCELRLFTIEFADGETVLPCRIDATPESIRLKYDGGAAVIYVRGTNELVIEAAGREVRLMLHKGGGFAYAVGEARHKLQKNEQFITVRTLAGQTTAVTRRYIHEDGVQRVEMAGLIARPRDGRVLLHVRSEPIETAAADADVDVEADLRVAHQQWAQRLAKLPPVAAEYRELAEQAWHLLWSSTVPKAGQLSADAIYMSKAAMCALWSWDHCFNALAVGLGDFDAGLAQWLLPFNLQQPTGQIPDRWTADEATWGVAKPPIHGWALSKLIAGRALEPGLTEKLYDHLSCFTEWWFNFRDSDGDGVPNYIWGCDSGWDNCTLFDLSNTPEAPDLSAFLVLQMATLADLALRLGRQQQAADWQLRSDRLLEKLYEHSWRENQFVAPVSRSHEYTADTTCLLFDMPVVLGSRLERNKFTRLVQRVESDFLTPFGLATENPRSRLYQSDGYWRGPIWAPSTYLIVDGLDRGGRRDLAVEIASRFCKLVRTAGGFYENYDALTGQGLRDCGYTWTAAVTLLLISEYLT